jgi:hypothetical protein
MQRKFPGKPNRFTVNASSWKMEKRVWMISQYFSKFNELVGARVSGHLTCDRFENESSFLSFRKFVTLDIKIILFYKRCIGKEHARLVLFEKKQKMKIISTDMKYDPRNQHFL